MNHEFFFYDHETSSELFGEGSGTRMYVGIELEMDKLRAYAGPENATYLLGGVKWKHDYVIVESESFLDPEHYTFYAWSTEKPTLELTLQNGQLTFVTFSN